MELAAARRPFLYFPLRDHFEQNRHVRHRLERYGAGRYMDYDDVAAGGHRRGDRRGDRPADRLPPGRDRRRRPGRSPDRAADLGSGDRAVRAAGPSVRVGRLADLVEEREGSGLALQGLSRRSRAAPPRSRARPGGQAELGERFDIQALVRLQQLEGVEGGSVRRAADRGSAGRTPPSGGTQRNRSSDSSMRSHSTHRSTSGRMPSSSSRCISYQRATRPGCHPRHPGARRRGAGARTGVGPRGAPRACRSASSAIYQAVAANSRESRRLSQACPTTTWVTTSKVRPRARAHGQFRERLQAPSDARRRAPDSPWRSP